MSEGVSMDQYIESTVNKREEWTRQTRTEYIRMNGLSGLVSRYELRNHFTRAMGTPGLTFVDKIVIQGKSIWNVLARQEIRAEFFESLEKSRNVGDQDRTIRGNSNWTIRRGRRDMGSHAPNREEGTDTGECGGGCDMG